MLNGQHAKPPAWSSGNKQMLRLKHPSCTNQHEGVDATSDTASKASPPHPTLTCEACVNEEEREVWRRSAGARGERSVSPVNPPPAAIKEEEEEELTSRRQAELEPPRRC